MNKAGFYTSEYLYINNVKVGSLFTSFVLQLQVFSIIDTLIFSSNKTTGPNSTLLRASLFFNLYFSSGVFPGSLPRLLKLPNFTTFLKKGSKPESQITDQFCCSQILIKTLKY